MESLPTNAVKAVIQNPEGKILFLKRNRQRKGAANWDLPGGLVEPGENEETALKREVYEELGVNAEVGQYIGSWSFIRQSDGVSVAARNYKVTIDSAKFSLSDEHEDAQWYSQSELSYLTLKDQSVLKALGE